MVNILLQEDIIWEFKSLSKKQNAIEIDMK